MGKMEKLILCRTIAAQEGVKFHKSSNILLEVLDCFVPDVLCLKLPGRAETLCLGSML